MDTSDFLGWGFVAIAALLIGGTLGVIALLCWRASLSIVAQFQKFARSFKRA